MSKPTIGSIIESFADDPGSATGLIPRILEAITAAGIPLDLGPMTPDARKHAATIDDRIAAKLDERSELERRTIKVGGVDVVIHQNDGHSER